MVAAMDRKVFAVDPMPENLHLIHRSLEEAGNSEMVTLINNPISDNSKSLYVPVSPDSTNQGGTKLVPEELLTPDNPDTKLISGDPVRSITLRELVAHTQATDIVVKIDVEVRWQEDQ